MKVNFEKSKALCSVNVSRQRREMFASISSIHFAADLGKCLGVPFI